MTVTIYHNPRYSKSRKTHELANMIKLLNVDVREIIRTGESIYTELGLRNESLSPNVLIDAVINNPTLLQRSIVINDGKAVIDRSPENVLDIL